MAATLGTGKKVGVAIAICVGGLGALFWMILAAVFGMATSYAEGFLSIKYRKFESDGSVIGGPFTYIEEGINITINTFVKGLNIPHIVGSIIVMFCIVTFAFTTIIGWNVYGEKCIAYLTKNNKKVVFIYKLIYIFFVAIAPFLTLDLIWTSASICNGLMAIPNLIAILFLSNVINKDTNDYFNNKKKESLN